MPEPSAGGPSIVAVPLLALVLAGITTTGTTAAQLRTRRARADAFEDSVARRTYAAAVNNWSALDESVVRYTALIEQRIAAAIRTPLKDRIIYRNETAVRAFWDQDYDAVVQVLGTHSQYPGRHLRYERRRFGLAGRSAVRQAV